MSEPTQTAAVPLPTNKRFIDLTGQVFGDLTVVAYVGRTRAASIWECRCVCGKVKLLNGNNLRRGCTTSCGCLRRREIGNIDATSAGRVCRTCGLWKPTPEFGTQLVGIAGGGKQRILKPHCKKCVNASTKRVRDGLTAEQRRKQNHRNRLSWLAPKLGVTAADLQAFLDTHGGACQICGARPRPPRYRLSIDHDHTSGALRGLLCSNCNLALGQFGDDPRLLRRAAEYLEKFQRERH